MSKNKYILAIFLIVGLSLIAYGNSVVNEFAYDDISVVAQNKFITDISKASSLFKYEYFELSGEKTYRPVVTATYIADCYLWGKNATGYHFTNLLLHILSAIVFFSIGCVLFKNQPVSLVAALLFGCHPIFTESICSIAFREDILCSLFLFSSFLFYILFRHKNKFIFVIPIYLFYMLSVFSKEMGVVLIPIFIIFDLFYRRKPESWVLFFINYLFIMMITFFFFAVRFYWMQNPGDLFNRIPFSLSLFTKTIISYWTLYFFPVNLRPLYYHTKILPFAQDVIFAVVSVFVGLYGFINLEKKTKKEALFLISITYISFLPVLNIYPIRHVIAERYTYLPAVGFLFFMAIIFYNVTIKKYTRYIFILLISVLLIFTTRTISRNTVWKNNLTLWYNTARENPWLAEAFFSLGHAYQTKGNINKAVKAYKRAIKLNPEYFEPYVNLGNAYENKGNIKECIQYYKIAASIKPEESIAHFNLALAYFKINENDRALSEFKKCVKFDPDNYIAYNAIGNIYAKKGDNNKAKYYWLKSIKVKPDNVQAYLNLGSLFADTGNTKKAITFWRRALEIEPNNKQAKDNLMQFDNNN